MWTPHTPIPVEAAFDLFVNAAGGQRVSSLLTGSPSFENADYAFPTVDVIGELKEIETDFAEDARFRSKHEELLHRSVSEGRISVPIILGADRASGDFVEDFVRLFRPALSRIVKKANSQIRSTKQHLGWSGATGVLFLVNDGFVSLEPHFVQALVSDILTSAYSSVSCFVYMTVNTYVGLRLLLRIRHRGQEL